MQLQFQARKTILIIVLIISFIKLDAQKTFPHNGIYDEREGTYAFTNATIYVSPTQILENATLVIQKGKIIEVGATAIPPKDAVTINCRGKIIYPSFIDVFSSYGMPEVMPNITGPGRGRRAPQFISNKKGAFAWNEALKTEFKAAENFSVNEKDAETFRNAGFGTVMSHRLDGISRGAGVLVSLGDERENDAIMKPMAANILSFSKGSSTQDYPSSLMGSIALLRQTYLDAQWYATTKSSEEKNLTLETWNNVQALPQIFEVSDKLEALRAEKIASEFGKSFIIKGRGDEYQRLDDMKKMNTAFILPINFPEPYDVEDPIDAQQISLAELKHWELAPSNPARLATSSIPFAFTSTGLKDKKDFFKQIQKAIDAGLSEENALAALTTTPAKLLGVDSELGSLERGKWANFVITNGKIFSKDTKFYHNWIKGKGYVVNDLDIPSLQGNYNLMVGDVNYKGMTIVETGRDLSVLVYKNDTTKSKADVIQAKNNITITFLPPGDSMSQRNNLVRLFGVYEGGAFKGRGQLANGDWVNWSAAPTSESLPKAKENSKTPPALPRKDIGEVVYPFNAYGKTESPKASRLVIKNATVWTSDTEGILAGTDVLIEAGKILQVGKNLSPSNAVTVDGTGKYLTAGIIDEHSHITVSKGVNEGTQASSAEVRIGDVLNPEDVNIYRQLAGGVTSSHILHGSANPIGGQTELIKLRWGVSPEGLKYTNAPKFIKFALGENVKQSNWGDDNRIRFPQTRMGVEQVYDDYFTRAEEYAALKKSGKTYRPDIELDAIQEIIEGKRFITCHSYVQTEITMMMRVAEKHKVRVNTFTHILEGYKVADKMAKHGAAAGTFSDWWAYKFEVYNAIPQNAGIMQDQGVLVCINSDDAEMARRLNQEAAKSMMYSGMKEQDAWKMVTINPAKIMHVSERTGSIKVGKDADLVLWSDNPLSIYAKAEQTYVDGIKYFDLQDDIKLRDAAKKERARLVQKMIQAKKAGAPAQPVIARQNRLYDCDDVN